jgi:hypothetical protein
MKQVPDDVQLEMAKIFKDPALNPQQACQEAIRRLKEWLKDHPAK